MLEMSLVFRTTVGITVIFCVSVSNPLFFELFSIEFQIIQKGNHIFSEQQKAKQSFKGYSVRNPIVHFFLKNEASCQKYIFQFDRAGPGIYTIIHTRKVEPSTEKNIDVVQYRIKKTTSSQQILWCQKSSFPPRIQLAFQLNAHKPLQWGGQKISWTSLNFQFLFSCKSNSVAACSMIWYQSHRSFVSSEKSVIFKPNFLHHCWTQSFLILRGEF